MLPRGFFHFNYAPVFVPAVLSLAGLLLYMSAERQFLADLLHNRWSLQYLLLTPFIHGGVAHFLLNTLALHHLGGKMLLPLVGKRQFIMLLIAGACSANIANNLLSDAVAIGMSGAIMAIVAASLYPYGKAAMKLLFIHDILRLPPFQYRYLAAFIVLLDICGIVFNWNFFAHWAHLGGFACGLALGYLRFRRRLF